MGKPDAIQTLTTIEEETLILRFQTNPILLKNNSATNKTILRTFAVFRILSPRFQSVCIEYSPAEIIYISSCCRSRSDKDCFHHLTVALHLSLFCESDVQESIFMSLSFRFLLMVSLNRRRGRPLFL